MRTFYLFNLFVFCMLAVSCARLKPEQLSCEYLSNPPVIDNPQPRLEWINIAKEGERGQQQTAYQIRVASSKNKLSSPDLWDSGKIKSGESTGIKYQGRNLTSEQECWWQVRIWNQDDKASGWSEPTFWRMGLLSQKEWKAQWIGAPWQGEEALPKTANGPWGALDNFPPPAPMLRKNFKITKTVKSAIAFVTGLGYFELYMNGEKVGNDVLIPNQTNYGKRPNLKNGSIPLDDNFEEYKVMYLAYDIKDKLKNGENTVGSILGNGFYNPAKHWDEGYGTPRFIGQIHIKYTDGTDQWVVSDTSWKVSQSPILMDMMFYGENYDARKEQNGWCTSSFDDSKWEPATLRKAPEGKLVAQSSLPDRVTQQISPVKIEKKEDGKYLVDFGVEISGWVRLKDVTGSAGTQIHIAFNGNEYSGENTYTFKGEGPENYAPRFNWFVFSGIEITGWPGELKPENLVAEAVNTNVDKTAHFETSNELFNTINTIWQRSQLDNMHGSVASDCPHRERSAYTGDGQVACATVMHNFDARAFYQKWIADIRGAQNIETGYVPNAAPWQPGCGGGVAWGAAICIMPWEFYLHYGDKKMLKDNYDAMKKYVHYMQRWIDKNGIMHSQIPGNDGQPLRWFNLGEWVTPGALPPDDLVHTFYFWRCADIVSQTAKTLQHNEEAAKYEAMANQTKEAFYKHFYNKEKGTYGNSGANVFALRMGVPSEQYTSVVTALKENIEANNKHLDTGIFGTQFLFEVLADNGLQELAYEIMNQKDYPSFGNWIAQGATTMWEQWNGANSHNHPMFGGGLTWFYKKLAGINIDPQQPGYRHIIFKPQPVDELAYVTYSNQTPYGEAAVSWKKENNKFSLKVEIPVGSKASIYVPCSNVEDITENGVNYQDLKDLSFERMDGNYAVFSAGSGKYNFTVN